MFSLLFFAKFFDKLWVQQQKHIHFSRLPFTCLFSIVHRQFLKIAIGNCQLPQWKQEPQGLQRNKVTDLRTSTVRTTATAVWFEFNCGRGLWMVISLECMFIVLQQRVWVTGHFDLLYRFSVLFVRLPRHADVPTEQQSGKERKCEAANMTMSLTLTLTLFKDIICSGLSWCSLQI